MWHTLVDGNLIIFYYFVFIFVHIFAEKKDV